MLPETNRYLRDACDAGLLIGDFTRGKSLGDYLSDTMLRAAVERQFIIVGEAMTEGSKLNPAAFKNLTGFREKVRFRNVLVHGYSKIDHAIVWDIIQDDLPVVLSEVQTLLATAPAP